MGMKHPPADPRQAALELYPELDWQPSKLSFDSAELLRCLRLYQRGAVSMCEGESLTRVVVPRGAKTLAAVPLEAKGRWVDIPLGQDSRNLISSFARLLKLQREGAEGGVHAGQVVLPQPLR